MNSPTTKKKYKLECLLQTPCLDLTIPRVESSPSRWTLYSNSTGPANYLSGSKEPSKKSRSDSLHHQSIHFPTLLDSSHSPPAPLTSHALPSSWNKLKNERNKIVAVASHNFNPAQQNWFTTKREAFAVKWTITKFDYFIRSRLFLFIDQWSLIYLQGSLKSPLSLSFGEHIKTQDSRFCETTQTLPTK